MLTRVRSALLPAERESFQIFEKIAPNTSKRSPVEKICDEIMTLSLRELVELSRALNDPKIVKAVDPVFPIQNEIQPAKNRSPFPHPKHLFAGVDADNRPGMHTVFTR